MELSYYHNANSLVPIDFIPISIFIMSYLGTNVSVICKIVTLSISVAWTTAEVEKQSKAWRSVMLEVILAFVCMRINEINFDLLVNC